MPNDGYKVQSTSTSNLVGNAYYYTWVAGEYCTTPRLFSTTPIPPAPPTCVSQSAPSPTYPYAAKLRWCTDSTETTCQAIRIESGTQYQWPRYPSPATATISFSGSNSTSVSGITVDLGAGAKQILTATTAATTNSSTMATNIKNGINACTAAIAGACQIAGFSATSSGSTVTITSPAGTGGLAATPVVTKGNTGTMTITPAAFGGGMAGSLIRTDIVSGTTSYDYPNTTAKASTRTDCAGTHCTYAEEMTNYANWWAYYHTRMQMIKTSASIAFSQLGTNYRVGYASMDNNTGTDFLNVGSFNATQKLAFYNKFFAANPNNSTPLRQALADMGRYYAGKLNGTTFNGVTVTEPLQYSCQQNFLILSTDGYWNGNAGYQLDGSTAVGNQDGVEQRPFNDGGSAIVTTKTPVATTVQTQTVSPVTLTIPWNRTSVAIGGACSQAAGVTPSSCVQDNGHNSASATRTWCMVTNGEGGGSSDCSSSVNGNAVGTDTVQACRGQSNSTNKPTNSSGSNGTACKTDSAGTNWCVYASSSMPAATTAINCTLAEGGDNIWICTPTPGVTGSTVTTTNQSYTETEQGTSTSINNSVTTVTTTVVTTNGVPAPPSSSTSGPVVSNVSVNNTITSDTGPPTGLTTWTTISTASACTAAPLPAAGAGAPVAGTTTSTTPASPAPVTTTLSTTSATGTPTVTTTSSGGTFDTLADVAEYYYTTDLRTPALGNCTGAVVPPATAGVDVCTNDVPTSGLDGASTQHMTLFTIGLGASGYMLFSPTYPTDKSGDYFDVAHGTLANPAAGTCLWQASGACNWTTPVTNMQPNIDDLWHAAVNGRGTYFSATNPRTLNAALTNALSGVSARTGSSAAATTSNPNVTSGDNFVFSSTFTTQAWDGELIRQQLDLTTGALIPSQSTPLCAADWCAQALLDNTTYTSRVIYMRDTAATSPTLKLFQWGNLNASAPIDETSWFKLPNISGLSQLCTTGLYCLDATGTPLAPGANLVNYLRGDQSNEGDLTVTSKPFRIRQHLLGDIVNAEAVFVRKPLFTYADAGYSGFITAQTSRQGMVYAAGNDGMLHAFNADTGVEAWAYIPTAVLPNLYKLADKNYTNQHRFFVDGTPVVGDAYFGGAWHTILVAGQNGGGRSYYALDITTPATPTLLWEYSDTNMGYTYGNPVITKLQNGNWVVLVASGYNNVSPGDGVGRLYILNAGDGTLVRTISTGVGSAGTTTPFTPPNPSGLAKISGWVDNTDVDNTSLRAYGGDMFGNVWRFDINGNIGTSGYDAQLLTTVYSNAAGTIPQPITTKPELGLCGDVNPMVFVGTGRYLGISDLNDTNQQSLYGIKDNLSTAVMPNPQSSGSNFVQQTVTTTTCPANSPATVCSVGQTVRTSSKNAVNLATNNGWYVNLPDGVGATSGTTGSERANTDPVLALGTLGFTTNIPNSSVCTAGGYSYRYLLNYCTGAPVSTSTTGVSAIKLGNALATRGVFVRLPSGTIIQLTRLSDGTTLSTNVPIGTSGGATRRISWRELITE